MGGHLLRQGYLCSETGEQLLQREAHKKEGTKLNRYGKRTTGLLDYYLFSNPLKRFEEGSTCMVIS